MLCLLCMLIKFTRSWVHRILLHSYYLVPTSCISVNDRISGSEQSGGCHFYSSLGQTSGPWAKKSGCGRWAIIGMCGYTILRVATIGGQHRTLRSNWRWLYLEVARASSLVPVKEGDMIWAPTFEMISYSVLLITYFSIHIICS